MLNIDYSFGTEYNLVGIANYLNIFKLDKEVKNSLLVTFKFVLMSVPMKLLSALIIAMLLNQSIKGIGSAKACDIVASLELGKRVNQNIKSINGIKFNNSSLVFDYYKNIIGDKKQEYFYVVYLDSSKKIIKDKVLFMGTLNHSIVHPREVFKEGYLVSASSFICVHNHPSGNVLPSREDIEITKQLKEIGTMMGVPLVDHIIIGIDKYYSFFENGDI